MTTCKRVLALGCSGLLLGMASVVRADATATSSSDAGLMAQVQALQAKVAALEKNQSSDTWLNEARADQVKSLVRDVLADADTRASLLDGGMTAGYNAKDGHFQLASDNGDFVLNVGGQIDVRYVYNAREGNSTEQVDGNAKYTNGFEIPFAKITLSGQVVPKIGYTITISAERNTETVRTEEVLLTYKLADGLTLWAGETKGPFLREEIIDDAHQLAVDRSIIDNIFSIGRVQGIGLKIDAGDMVKLNISFNDGAGSGEPATPGLNSGVFGGSPNKAFYGGNAQFAFTGRADFKAKGEWSQLDDFNGWSDGPMGVFFGAAAHYESARTGINQAGGSGGFLPYDSFILWTVDSTFKGPGYGFYAAIVGASSNGVSGPPAAHQSNGSDSIAAMIQGSFFVVPNKVEPFARFEWISLDDPGLGGSPGAQDIKILTFGANWYLNRQNAKFTLDVVWALDPLTGVNTQAGIGNLGLLPDRTGNQNQIAVRAQFQVLF